MKQYIKLSNECNLNCSNCYRKYNLEDSSSNIINKIKENRIIIFGGEPTLDINKLKSITNQLTKKEVVIITNGSFLQDSDKTKVIDEISTEIIIKAEPFIQQNININLLNKIKNKTKILIQIRKTTNIPKIINYFIPIIKEFIFEFFFPENTNELNNYSEYINYVEFYEKINQIKNQELILHTANIPECIKVLFNDNTKKYDGSSYDIKENTDKTICQLCENLDNCDGLFAHKNDLIINQIKNIPLKPIEAKLEITYDCNLNCEFCMNKNSKQTQNELTTDEIKTNIKILKNNDIQTIRFTGGEPTIRKDIWDLIEYAKELQLKVLLNTNGLKLEENDIEFINNNVDQIMISIHKINSETKQIKKILTNLNKPRKIINVITNHETINNFEIYEQLSQDCKSEITYLRPIDNPNTKNSINFKELENLIDKIHIHNTSSKYKIHITALPFCFYKPEILKDISNGFWTCGIGNTIVLNPNGELKYCYSINEPNTKLNENNFKEITNSPIFSNTKNGILIPNECKVCYLLSQCLGGCRFSALKNKGNIAELDPFARPENIK
ncbi:radical SAM protein [Candidatus Woesearchaeota archaeon]|nr:radical SAM protein [Candidatus Woesearchaeota archaeon]